MQLPPGPSYLLHSFPYFVVPSTIVYACLTLANEHLTLAIPTWLTVLIAILARPAIFLFNRHYSRFADSRNAAANNAVVPPHVRESPFNVISKISKSFKKGYPGGFMMLPRFLSKTNGYMLFHVSRFHARVDETVRKCIPNKTFHRYTGAFVTCPWRILKKTFTCSWSRWNPTMSRYLSIVFVISVIDTVFLCQGDPCHPIWCLWQG